MYDNLLNSKLTFFQRIANMNVAKSCFPNTYMQGLKNVRDTYRNILLIITYTILSHR